MRIASLALAGLVSTTLWLGALGGCSSDDDSAGGGGSPSTGGSAGSSATGGSAGGGGTPADASSDAEPDSATPPSDYDTFQEILKGTLEAKQGLVAIAKSGGWPIESPQGYLFARLDDGAGPYLLSGDHQGWKGAAMKSEAGLFWLVVAIPSPNGSKYKFIDGGGKFAADPLGRRYGYDNYGEFSLVRSNADHLERWPEVGGSGIGPRTLRARVPAANATHHLYVHDGQNLFDPNGPFGSWKLDASLGPATLAIGIDNAGAARMDEYTHVPDDIGSGGLVGGKADAYADYVHDVVRPLIEKAYGKPQRVGVMGSSLGGLISFHQVLRHPGAWDYAASLSGTFGWGSIGVKNETLIERFQKAPKQSTRLYLDSGGDAGSGCADTDGDGTFDDTADADDNYCETVQMRDGLGTTGWVLDTDLWYFWQSGAPHNEAAWAARVWRPLQYFEAL